MRKMIITILAIICLIAAHLVGEASDKRAWEIEQLRPLQSMADDLLHENAMLESKALRLEIALSESQPAFLLEVAEREQVERIVMSEAGNQSFDGQAAVAQTIRDRHNMWGQSYKR